MLHNVPSSSPPPDPFRVGLSLEDLLTMARVELEEARRRLIENKNIQWEGRIVDTFLELLERNTLPTFDVRWMERKLG